MLTKTIYKKCKTLDMPLLFTSLFITMYVKRYKYKQEIEGNKLKIGKKKYKRVLSESILGRKSSTVKKKTFKKSSSNYFFLKNEKKSTKRTTSRTLKKKAKEKGNEY